MCRHIPPAPGCQRGPDSWPRSPGSSCQVRPPSVERNRAASSDPGVDGVRVGQRRFEVPDPLELPGVLRAVVPLVRARDAVVGELVADRLPRLAAVVGALDHLPEPAARLRRIEPVRVDGRALDVVDLPAREVGAADLPPFAPAVRRQDERALPCADQDSYSAHPGLLSAMRSLPPSDRLAGTRGLTYRATVIHDACPIVHLIAVRRGKATSCPLPRDRPRVDPAPEIKRASRPRPPRRCRATGRAVVGGRRPPRSRCSGRPARAPSISRNLCAVQSSSFSPAWKRWNPPRAAWIGAARTALRAYLRVSTRPGVAPAGRRRPGPRSVSRTSERSSGTVSMTRRRRPGPAAAPPVLLGMGAGDGPGQPGAGEDLGRPAAR